MMCGAVSTKKKHTQYNRKFKKKTKKSHAVRRVRRKAEKNKPGSLRIRARSREETLKSNAPRGRPRGKVSATFDI